MRPDLDVARWQVVAGRPLSTGSPASRTALATVLRLTRSPIVTSTRQPFDSPALSVAFDSALETVKTVKTVAAAAVSRCPRAARTLLRAVRRERLLAGL